MKKLKIATSIIAATFFATITVQADVFTISTNAPSVYLSESFNAQDLVGSITIGGMGPNRIDLTGNNNRYAGQSVTINPTNNVVADSITFRSYTDLDFNDGGTNTFELYILGANITVGSYTYDFSTHSILKGDYLTFDLAGVDLNAGVEYQFQMYYSEFDDDNKLGFERDQGGNSYLGGALFSGSDTNAAIAMPVNNAWLGASSDLTFFLQGTATPYTPPVLPIEVSTAAPTVDEVLESYDATENLSAMSPRRKVTQTVPNRTLGQTFTVTNEIFSIDALTLFGKHAIDFSGDGGTHTFLIAFMKETSNDGATDKFIETFTFDMTGQNVAADERYITFNLGTPMSNLVAGTYSFELWWGEENDLNDKAFERSAGGSHYAGGGQISESPVTVFPNANKAPNAVNDMTFYIHGSDEDSMPVVHTVSTNAPVIDETVLEHFQVTSDLAGWDARRVEEPTSVDANNRVLGQTFTLDHTGEVTLTAISARQYPDWNGDLRGTTNAHTYLVAISADTNNDGKGDALLGTFEYDFRSEYMNKGEYFTFHLGSGISGVTGGTYQIEYYWGEVDADSKGFNLERSSANNNYVDGGEFSKFQNDGTFPVLENGNVNVTKDITFYVHGFVPPDLEDFASWATDNITDPAKRGATDDVEPDGMDNLTEYALGGDPEVDDAATKLPTSEMVADGGSDWLEYIYNRRSDYVARNLSYTVQSTDMLTMPQWKNGAPVVYVGFGASVEAGFDSVTNRLDTDTASDYFLRLHIQEN